MQGSYLGTPRLAFVRKGREMANITGEKISESQVVESVRLGAAVLEIELDQFTAMPVWGEPPGYRLVVEETDTSSSSTWDQLADRVDRSLQELNMEYREKRSTGRLAPLQSLSTGWAIFGAAARHNV